MRTRTIRQAHEAPGKTECPLIGDLRFASLLPHDEWHALPLAIRSRFSHRATGGEAVVYAGVVADVRMTFVGRLFAHLAVLVGGPLPLAEDAHMPAVVSVTEDATCGGQHWTRIYAKRRGFPQVIQSTKRFVGPTGLEEQVSRGVGMALTVHEVGGALVFRSACYFLKLRDLRVRLPNWLTPGALTVTHREEEGGQFSFLLEIVHPLFGLVVRQFALFREIRK